MSRIYFHSINGEVEIYGSERALADVYVQKLALSILNIGDNYELIKKIINPRHYLSDPNYINNPSINIPAIENVIRISVIESNSSADNFPFLLDNKPLNMWEVSLNTAMSVGSNPIKLLARLHAQCEIHTYIRGENRKWLSDIIQEGLQDSIYRKNSGWEKLIEFLKLDDKNTVVTSYSVCRQFPNPEIIPEFNIEDPWEKWEKLGTVKQWELCLEKLYQQKGNLEISPENFDIKFGNSMNAFELLNILNENNITNNP